MTAHFKGRGSRATRSRPLDFSKAPVECILVSILLIVGQGSKVLLYSRVDLCRGEGAFVRVVNLWVDFYVSR